MAWWLCPNEPRCQHGAILHDIDEMDDPLPRCTVEGCACGKPTVEIPDAFHVCGKCGELVEPNEGGKVAVETFDGSAPEVGAGSLCQACYLPVVAMVTEYLFDERGVTNG